MKRGGSSTVVVSVILLLFIGGALFLYNSKEFEQNKPKIAMNETIFWTLQTPFEINVEDDEKIKSAKARLYESGGKFISELTVELGEGNITKITPPKGLMMAKDDTYMLEVEVVDNSLWNFGEGNSAKKVSKVVVDKIKPKVEVVTNSYSTTKGGSSLVIFKVIEQNLDSLVIENQDDKFFPQKFLKDGYYIALIAWSVKKDTFAPKIVATDRAGNKTTTQINYYIKDRKYKISKIELKDNFLNGKIAELVEEQNLGSQIVDPIERFKYVNEKLRVESERNIYKNSVKITIDGKPTDFFIKPFYPLKNGAAVAAFGDSRYFYYNKKEISSSWHLGLDLASTKNAEMVASNKGDVVYAGYNGIYGNSILIHHGLGLYTLYGHCENMFVKDGDRVLEGSRIANTGKSGLALGDHLHFGVLVHGIEVRPEEWMDAQWMKLNIYDVIDGGKKAVGTL